MLEETYQGLIYQGYSSEFLEKISTNREMHKNIMHLNIDKNDAMVKCIAITDRGSYYQIIEHIKDKNKSYEPTINVVSKSIIDLLI